MLKHKLFRAEPKSMEHLMLVADKYAMADSFMKIPIRLDADGVLITGELEKREQAGPSNQASRPSGRDGRDRPYHDNRDNPKRSGAMAEERYGAVQAVNDAVANRPQTAKAGTPAQGKMTANGATGPSTRWGLC